MVAMEHKRKTSWDSKVSNSFFPLFAWLVDWIEGSVMKVYVRVF